MALPTETNLYSVLSLYSQGRKIQPSTDAGRSLLWYITDLQLINIVAGIRVPQTVIPLIKREVIQDLVTGEPEALIILASQPW